MVENLIELAYKLTQAGKPFVLATVVWCERPTSAKPGAQAIIQADGTITGWIGGSCAQPVVLREALRILREGDDPYLLRLGAPETEIERTGVRVGAEGGRSKFVAEVEGHADPIPLACSRALAKAWRLAKRCWGSLAKAIMITFSTSGESAGSFSCKEAGVAKTCWLAISVKDP